MPLITIIEKTKIRTRAAINQIIGESKLPAYLMEGIITDILCDIREQKNTEMIQATEQIINQEKEPKEADENKRKKQPQESKKAGKNVRSVVAGEQATKERREK